MTPTKDEKQAVALLWRRYHQKPDDHLRDALIVQYLHLVKFAVGRVAAGLPSHIKLDDLYSSGTTGLIKAVEKFDPEKNNKFETYAVLLIKGAIIDELRRLDWVPRSVHQKAHLIQSAQNILQQQLGREPSDAELAHHLGLSEESLSELLERVRPAVLIPLNAELKQDEESVPMAEKIADERAFTSFEIAHRNESNRFLEKAIEDLPEQERQVLVLYYYEELMLKEIGKVLGVSESRVSQIHTKALLKLRSKLKSFQT